MTQSSLRKAVLQRLDRLMLSRCLSLPVVSLCIYLWRIRLRVDMDEDEDEDEDEDIADFIWPQI